MTGRIFAAFGLALVLSACGGEPEAPAADQGERQAEGDVLGGTISDDMLPLDTVTSQSPPVKEADIPESESDGGSEGGSSAPAAPAEAAPAAEAEEADTEETEE